MSLLFSIAVRLEVFCASGNWYVFLPVNLYNCSEVVFRGLSPRLFRKCVPSLVCKIQKYKLIYFGWSFRGHSSPSVKPRAKLCRASVVCALNE